jgi:hypothetical protein
VVWYAKFDVTPELQDYIKKIQIEKLS